MQVAADVIVAGAEDSFEKTYRAGSLRTPLPEWVRPEVQCNIWLTPWRTSVLSIITGGGK